MRPVAVAALLSLLSFPGLAEDGIPVESDLVRSACSACHASDETGRMSRISYVRKAPEGWQLTLKRMIRTAGLDLSEEQARAIVRYLSDHHGLAPEEERPYLYRAEKRPQLETVEDEEIERTCTRCHLAARFLTQRRTEEEWKLLKGMHLGYFPVIEFQTFRGGRGDGEDAGDTGSTRSEWRVDRVLETLARSYPLETPALRRFRAKGPPRSIEGRWLFATHVPGEGPASGVVRVARAEDGYTYSGELKLSDGSRHRRDGSGVLYGGYSWRGRSKGTGLGELREVLILSEDGNELSGRVFDGAFGELGLDVTLTRLGADPAVAALWPRAIRTGDRAEVRLLGANFDASLSRDDVRLGQGLEVLDVRVADSETLELTIAAGEDALAGARDVVVGTASEIDGFAVYDRVDYVEVVPGEALARVGGGAGVPEQLARFEAVAYHRGPDDEPLTGDDVALGTIPNEDVRWSIEEYHIRHEDDDVAFVGTIDGNGVFTPSRDGPNPERELGANNFGDVWVVARYAPVGSGRELRGRARLVVTIPVYVYWELFP